MTIFLDKKKKINVSVNIRLYKYFIIEIMDTNRFEIML